MTVLIEAARASITASDPNMSIEDKKAIQDLR
jgi:hypothetical protein